MIITKIMGGLGNQMFQYAAGRRLAYINNTILKLDTTWYREQGLDSRRNYELDIFNIVENLATDREIKKIKGVRGSFPERVLANRLPWLYLKFWPNSKKYVLEDPAKAFDSKILALTGDTYLEGWWQSGKYFADIREIILHDFTFKSPLDKENQKLLKEIASSHSVSLHVRRGDYVKNKNYRSYYAHQGIGYYRKGLKIIRRKTKKPTLFIFSDDPEWVKKNLRFDCRTVYVTHNVGKKDYEDMRLMSNCRHNIIANSAFSWWGAWLNKNPDKIIVAPKRWFLAKEVKVEDMLLKEWIAI